MKIPFSRPVIGQEEKEAVLKVMDSGWLTTGQECFLFENEFAKKIGVKHAIAMNSGTAGLHVGLKAIGVGHGDTVVTTPYTFVATAEVIEQTGADIDFVDIKEDEPLIDVDNLRYRFGHCKAIIPVHMAGQECDVLQIAKDNNLEVIEDAAHSFPARDKDGNYIGTKGDMGVYSFYANKTITTGEGGMLVTNNDKIAKKAKSIRLHGIDRDVWNRYQSEKPSWYYEVNELGYKYNMPDILAAIGRQQLKKADYFMRQRKEIVKLYIFGLQEYDFVKLPEYSDNHSWHLFQIAINADKLTIDRNRFIELLAESGIGSSVHFIPLHINPYYRNKYGFKPYDFPNTMNFYLNTISLPVYPGLTIEEVQYVIKKIKEIGKKYYK